MVYFNSDLNKTGVVYLIILLLDGADRSIYISEMVWISKRIKLIIYKNELLNRNLPIFNE